MVADAVEPADVAPDQPRRRVRPCRRPLRRTRGSAASGRGGSRPWSSRAAASSEPIAPSVFGRPIRSRTGRRAKGGRSRFAPAPIDARNAIECSLDSLRQIDLRTFLAHRFMTRRAQDRARARGWARRTLCGSSRSIVSASRARSTGLVRKSSKPAPRRWRDGPRPSRWRSARSIGARRAPGLALGAPDAARGLEAVEARHLDVHQDDRRSGGLRRAPRRRRARAASSPSCARTTSKPSRRSAFWATTALMSLSSASSARIACAVVGAALARPVGGPAAAGGNSLARRSNSERARTGLTSQPSKPLQRGLPEGAPLERRETARGSWARRRRAPPGPGDWSPRRRARNRR